MQWRTALSMRSRGPSCHQSSHNTNPGSIISRSPNMAWISGRVRKRPLPIGLWMNLSSIFAASSLSSGSSGSCGSKKCEIATNDPDGSASM